MNNDDDMTTKEEKGISLLLANHRIAVLVIGATLIALAFTGVGLYLYHATGTAQIDLSRLEYREMAKESTEEEKTDYKEFPETGPINSDTLKEFNTLFNQHVELITSVDAFSGDPLDPAALNIENRE